MKILERFTKNSIRLWTLISLYSGIVWFGAGERFGIAVSIIAMLVLWCGFLLRRSRIGRLFEPMHLPACLIVTAMTGFGVFRFSSALQNEALAALFLLALSVAFAFALIRLFSVSNHPNAGERSA